MKYMNIPPDLDINYVMAELLFEEMTDELLERLAQYNEVLKEIAIEAGDKTYEQVGVDGPCIFVFEEAF